MNEVKIDILFAGIAFPASSFSPQCIVVRAIAVVNLSVEQHRVQAV